MKNISAKVIIPCFAYWDSFISGLVVLDNIYIGTAMMAILGGWGFIRNGYVLGYRILFLLMLIIVPSILGYTFYGYSSKSFVSLFVAIGIGFYVNYFVNYEVFKKIISGISKSALLVSAFLAVMYPFLEVEGRLFLGANEPSHIAIALIGPTFYYAFKRQFKKLVPLIIAILMTQSLTVILAGMIFIFAFIPGRKNFLTKVFKKSVLLSIILGVSLLIPAVAWRLSTFSVLWLNFSFSNVNGTFFSFLSHFMTYPVLIVPNYLVGLGFFNYQEYLYQPEIQSYFNTNPVFLQRLTNEFGGHSMLLRMLNELSLFALAIFYIIIRRLSALSKVDITIFGFLGVMILARCLKLAGYFDFGFLFFIISIMIIRLHKKQIKN